MSDEDHIPGTAVPDNALHRASLWLEDVKYGLGREDAVVERVEPELWSEFLRLVELDEALTGEQLREGALYYGLNLLRMLTGGRLTVSIASPTADGGFINLGDVLVSVWLDGFMHGAATKAGKRGLSNQELREGAE